MLFRDCFGLVITVTLEIFCPGKACVISQYCLYRMLIQPFLSVERAFFVSQKSVFIYLRCAMCWSPVCYDYMQNRRLNTDRPLPVCFRTILGEFTLYVYSPLFNQIRSNWYLFPAHLKTNYWFMINVQIIFGIISFVISIYISAMSTIFP